MKKSEYYKMFERCTKLEKQNEKMKAVIEATIETMSYALSYVSGLELSVEDDINLSIKKLKI